MNSSLLIRPYDVADIPQLVAIENQVQFSPWTATMFEQQLSIERYSGRVLCQSGQVVGFYLIEQVVDEITLHNIAVAPEWQGKGYGKRLIENVAVLATQLQASQIFLEVRESNTPARSLYELAGYHQVGERQGYYAAPWGREAAIVMMKSLEVG